MKNKKIIIGSRGSKLALIYAERAKAELLKKSEIESIDIKSITTTGDTITDEEYLSMVVRDYFVKQSNKSC